MLIVMVIIGMLFYYSTILLVNPINILSYRFSDLYISQTLSIVHLGIIVKTLILH
jgi:hypothetical protein